MQRLPRRTRASLRLGRLSPQTLDPEPERLTRTWPNHHGLQIHMHPSHLAPTLISVLGVTRPQPIDVIRHYLHKDPSCATLAWRANQTAHTLHACQARVLLSPESHPQPWCPALSALVRGLSFGVQADVPTRSHQSGAAATKCGVVYKVKIDNGMENRPRLFHC